MSIRKVVAGLLITAGIAIMAVPFFWRATGEKQTEQLISEFEQTLEDDYDEETDVEEEQTSISKEDEAILKEGGVIGIIEIPGLDIRYPVMEGTTSKVLNAGIGHIEETAGIGESGNCVLCGHNGSRLEVKAQVKSTARSIVDEAKAKGRAALYRVSEFLGIKKRLLDIRENARGAIKTTDKDIAKTALLAKGFREAGQTAANAFRTFADKPEVDYSQKEQKHSITKAVLAPMKAVKKMLVSMELHLDASIDKLDNLAMNVKLDKEKHMENIKEQEQTESERAEAERVEAEVVYSPMVTEPQEYQYNADAFEARGVDEVKQEATHKEVSKVREDKTR